MSAAKTVQRTYLEMREQPSIDEVVWDDRIQIVHAIKPTVSFYRYLYNTVGESWTWIDRRKMSDEDLKQTIQNDKIQVHVLYLLGVPAGYIELDFRNSLEIEIAYFGLMPEFIGQGFGKKFLQWGISRAWKVSPQRVWLHTCTLDHPGALPLYEKAGFKKYKTEEYILKEKE